MDTMKKGKTATCSVYTSIVHMHCSFTKLHMLVTGLSFCMRAFIEWFFAGAGLHYTISWKKLQCILRVVFWWIFLYFCDDANVEKN